VEPVFVLMDVLAFAPERELVGLDVQVEALGLTLATPPNKTSANRAALTLN